MSIIFRSKPHRQTTSDSPSELSTRSQSTTETGGQHHNHHTKNSHAANVQTSIMTQTPSSTHHHHHQHRQHQKDHQQQQQQLTLFHQQQQHQLQQLQQPPHLQHQSLRRNSAIGGASVGGVSNQHQQLHFDPLNAVALSGSEIISGPQILPINNPTSASIVVGGGGQTYQQHLAGKLSHNIIMHDGSSGRTSTSSKHPNSHNIVTSELHHSSSIAGKFNVCNS